MKKVLILEDEVSIRSFVVINLKRAGYDVVEAGTGEEALEMMDERMILKTDIYNVLDYMLKSGEAVEDAESGMLIARKRCGNVTFWTAYTETAEGYTVHRAYSHRMTVEKRN